MNNIWKRSLSLILAVVMILGAVPMNVFATDAIVEEASEPAEHVHEYVGSVEAEATCGAEGAMLYACACGDSYSDVIPATGEHQWDEGEVTLEATAEADGEITFTCVVCGNVYIEDIPAEVNEESAPAEAADEVAPAEAKNEVAPIANAVYGTKEKPYGILWVDGGENGDRDSAEIGLELVGSGLRARVLEAVGRAGDVSNGSVKVLFQGADTGNVFELMSKQDELINAFKGDETARSTCFQINGDDYWVGIKKIQFAEIVVEAVISNEGTPDNLSGLVAGKLSNPVIKIMHGGTDWYEATARREGAITVSSKSVSPAWPVVGGTKTYKNAVTVTMTDNLGNAPEEVSQDLVLKDSTPSYTVTYKLSPDEIWRTATVFKGNAAPDYTPIRNYYTFLGWDQELSTNVTADLTYTATWQPGIDQDGDGVDDRDQVYTITYLDDENGNVYAELTLSYGAALTHPAAPVREGYDFQRWIFVSGSSSAIVKGNATYKATWKAKVTEPEPGVPVVPEQTVVVKYYMYDEEAGEDVVIEETIKSKETATEYPVEDPSNDGMAWLGWFVADENGVALDINGDPITNIQTQILPKSYDFTAEVTANLNLRLVYGSDENNNNQIDGAPKYDDNGDAIVDENGDYVYDSIAIYKFWNDSANVDTDKYPMNTKYVDGATAFDESVLEGVNYLPDSLNDTVKFAGWKLVKTVDGSGKVIFNCKPDFAADENQNGVFDANEIVGFAVETSEDNYDFSDFAAEFAGQITVTVNGEALNANTVLFDSLAGADIEIIGSADTYIAYVSALDKNAGTEMNLDLMGDNNALAGFIQDLDVQAELDKSGLPGYLVVIAAEQIKEKTGTHLTIEKGGKYNGFTAKEIYDAVMASPSRVPAMAVMASSGSEAAVSVQYLAREMQTVTVNVEALYDWFESNYGAQIVSVLDAQLGIDTNPMGEHVINITMPRVWKNVNETVSPVVLSAQDVANQKVADYINNFVATLKKEEATDAELSKLLEDLGFMEYQIEQDVKAKANIHPFAYNAEGAASFTETVNITYTSALDANYGYTRSGVTVNVADNRSDAAVSANAVSVTYGANDNTILSKVSSASGNLTMPVSFGNLSAGVYGGVSAIFAGSADYKPDRATFTLTINRDSVTVDVPTVIVKKLDTPYDASPVVNRSNVDVVSVIAGLDLNALNLGLGTLENPGTADNIDVKIWVKVPNTLKNLLNFAKKMTETMDDSSGAIDSLNKVNLNDKHFDTWDAAIAEIEKVLELLSVDDARLTRVLELVKNQTRANGAVDLVFADEFPKDPGAYVNAALELDVNYDETTQKDNVGLIAISPVLTMPNEGGVQLYHETDGVQNFFEQVANGQPYELKVKHNGTPVDADVYYYGFDNSLSVHYYGEETEADDGKAAPIKAGAYLASTIYTDANGKKIGSDMAIILLGVEKSYTEVKGENVVYDGQKHTLEVIVKDENGPVSAGKTIISGYIGNNSEVSTAGLGALKSEINIDFPKTLDNLWNNRFVPNFKDYTGVNLPDDFKVEHVVKFLEKCLEWNEAQALENKLNNLGIPEKYTDKFPNAYAERVCNELLTVLRKLDGKLTVTFHDTYKNGNLNFGYTEYGVYLYCAVTTDPNYLPSVGGGVLVIKAAEEDFTMLDTVRPYTGEGHTPIILDETGRQYFMLVSGIIDGKQSVSFLMDDDLKTLVENKYTAKYAQALDGLTVGELRDKTNGKADALSEMIVDAIIAREEAIIRGRFDKDPAKLTAALEKLQKRVDDYRTAMIEKMVAKIIDLSALIQDENTTILLNKKPVDAGEYLVHAFSYAIAYEEATLTIAPVYVRATVTDQEKNAGEADPYQDNKWPFVLSYYSYESDEFGALSEVAASLPAGVTMADLQLDVKTSRVSGEDPGEYAINITSATIGAEVPNVATAFEEAGKVGGTFTIHESQTVITGQIGRASASLRLKSEVHINVAFDITGFEGLQNIEDNMGLLIWHDKSIPMDECDITNAHEIIEGGEYDTNYNKYVVRTRGISAKNMGNLDGRIFFKIYIKTGENSYVYSPRYGYSPQQYCENKVSGNYPEDLKLLCVALMNYGADAQKYFAEEGIYTLPEKLMNDVDIFAPYQENIKSYDSSMIDALAAADKTKHVNFKADLDAFERVNSFITLTGALQLNFTTDLANTNYTEAGILLWPASVYNSVDTLSWENAIKIPSGAVGADSYESRFTGIAAKDMGDTVFGCSYIKVDGEYKYYGIYKNSIEAYAHKMMNGAGTTLKDLLESTVVYGDYAKVYFANNEDNSN